MNMPSEISSNPRTDLERAQERDLHARALDGVLKSSWAMLAMLCRDVERDRDWELLGWHSLDAWISDALQFSRSTAYDALSLLKELGEDITDEVLLAIPHATAHILRQLPKSVRRDPEIQSAARNGKPKDFRKKIALEHPEAHVELQIEKKLFWSESAWALAEETVNAWRVLNEVPGATYEEVFESIFAEWLDSPWEPESPYSNREKVQQRKSGTPII